MDATELRVKTTTAERDRCLRQYLANSTSSVRGCRRDRTGYRFGKFSESGRRDSCGWLLAESRLRPPDNQMSESVPDTTDGRDGVARVDSHG